jgi:hypothetical protein
MRSILIFLCFTSTVVNFINADVYLQSPRGSNDRLNEKSANRKNANRVFDSQVCVQIFLLHLGCVDLEKILFRSILEYLYASMRFLNINNISIWHT